MKETDAEKLLRIASNYNKGKYDEQLRKNYSIQGHIKMQIALGYAKGSRDRVFNNDAFKHFIVLQDFVEYK